MPDDVGLLSVIPIGLPVFGGIVAAIVVAVFATVIVRGVGQGSRARASLADERPPPTGRQTSSPTGSAIIDHLVIRSRSRRLARLSSRHEFACQQRAGRWVSARSCLT